MIKKCIGMLERIIGFFLLFGSVMFFLAPVPGPYTGKGIDALCVLFSIGIIGLLFLFLGQTIKCRKEWARIINIIGLPFLSCILIYIYFRFCFYPGLIKIDSMLPKIIISLSVLAIFNVLTIFYLTRPKIKEQFRYELPSKKSDNTA